MLEIPRVQNKSKQVERSFLTDMVSEGRVFFSTLPLGSVALRASFSDESPLFHMRLHGDVLELGMDRLMSVSFPCYYPIRNLPPTTPTSTGVFIWKKRSTDRLGLVVHFIPKLSRPHIWFHNGTYICFLDLACPPNATQCLP